MMGVAELNAFGAVRAYLCDVVGCSVGRVASVRRFRDGNRHAVYKVSYHGARGAEQHAVVRVSFDGVPADCAQAQREATVLEHLNGAGAPRIHDFRCTSSWFATPVMCMEFVPGLQRDLGSAALDEIERLGSVVGSLHGRAAGSLAESLGDIAGIASYAEHRLRSILAGMAWVRDPLPALVQERLNGAAALLETRWQTWRGAESFRTGETLALLHGDIGPGNVLWGREPVLIDWEYTRLGDPADEIAYTLDQNGLTRPRRQAFWSGYRRCETSQARLTQIAQRVDWWERLTLLGSTLWWAERSVRRAEADAAARIDPTVPRDHDYYFGHLISRLGRLQDLLA